MFDLLQIADSLIKTMQQVIPMRPEIESELVKLKKDLEYYKNTYGFYGLKGGTETEDMDYEELSFLKALSKDIMPLKVKIGGVEARTDIRFCHSTCKFDFSPYGRIRVCLTKLRSNPESPDPQSRLRKNSQIHQS